MAHFYGTVQGRSRVRATRTGTLASGMVVTCNGWNGGVTVEAHYNELTQQDEFTVIRTRGSAGGGETQTIASFSEDDMLVTMATFAPTTDTDVVLAPAAGTASLNYILSNTETGRMHSGLIHGIHTPEPLLTHDPDPTSPCCGITCAACARNCPDCRASCFCVSDLSRE